ncbi:hypothetical protein DFQ14_106149 [Halopolyspora algeriensis]|uniref:Fatty acid desaturase n=1 Tax=Halopolyspora algeriensis TaxID=1500506 RepID=A0A368VPL3_9ACTN|nr:hypothetical protein DFQ14_106149 [Halopolyspora algeriensis]TQM47546.1 hypothetical protein FHU43_3540 [Halopolyspora algeriensis]
MSTTETPSQASRSGDAHVPMVGDQHTRGAMALIALFTITPLLALFAAVPVAWGWGLGWVDVGLAVLFYYASGLGVTVGFHRHFTHRSFKARKPLRIALAVAGSFAVQGPVMRPTSGRWPSRPSASPGTTPTTPTRPAPATESSAANSTPRPG